jgi:hypothetical protein
VCVCDGELEGGGEKANLADEAPVVHLLARNKIRSLQFLTTGSIRALFRRSSLHNSLAGFSSLSLPEPPSPVTVVFSLSHRADLQLSA